MKKNLHQQLVNTAVLCARIIALISLIVSQFFGAVQPVSALSAPIITEGAFISVNMSVNGTPNAFDLTLHATDADAGDTLTWSISSQASHGTASASGTGNSKLIGYTPDTDYIGWEPFVVQVEDGHGGIDTIIVAVCVSNARFHAQIVQNDVQGHDWPLGANITLTIDDPSNGDWCGFYRYEKC